MTLWIAYATTGKELEAEEAIKAMGSEWTSTYLRRAYMCPVCRAWHVGQAPVTGKGRT